MKVLMVCKGNICRSPMAEGIAKTLIKEQGRDDLTVDSAGTHGYHIGASADKRAINTAKAHGIDISTLKARQISAQDLQRFDLILVADDENLRQLQALADNQAQLQKIHKMLKHHPDNTNQDLPDPYYGNQEDFEHCYQLLEKALNTWFEVL